MKIRRSTALLAVAATSALALSGCAAGGGGGGSSDTLTLLTYEDAGPTEVLTEQLKGFTEETGIKVDVQDLPGSGAAVYPGKLRTQLAGGKGPDVWRIWGGSLGGPLATGGFAEDLTPYYEEYGWADEVPESFVAGMTWDDTRYGLPAYSNTVTAWYSLDAFEKAGISAAPATYDELVDANEKLVASGQVPLGTGGKFGWHIMRLFEYLLEKNAGPDLHDQLLAGEASWDDPAVVESFAELKEWSDKGWVPDGVMALDPAQEEPGFTTGKYAYTIAGGWADSNYIQQTDDPSAFGVFALPTDQTPMRHSGWVEGYMINKNSANKDAAAQLLDYLSQPETIQALGITNSAVTAGAVDAEEFPLAAENAKIGADEPFYTIQDQAFPPELATGFYEVQSQVVQGQLSPEDAAAKMQEIVPAGLE